MRMLFFVFTTLLFTGITQAQYVGIGTATPVAQLHVQGSANSPSIPGATSTGILRVGVSNIEGIDIGKMGASPYAAWIQAGYNNTEADPLSLQPSGGKVGIGTIDPKAALDINSTTQGFLPPRMTIAQRDAITSPAIGLVVFNTDCDELEVYNGTIWKNMSGAAACMVIGPSNVGICGQQWIVKNLEVTTYRNGDPIPETPGWPVPTGGWCYYYHNPVNAPYGRLYNWLAVTDPRGLAPVGWHIASDAEWTVLADCLGGASVAGGKLKEVGTAHWGSPNTDATNSSGFTGLAGGFRKNDGEFDKLTVIGFWWTSTERDISTGYSRNIGYNNGVLNSGWHTKSNFLSVRIIKD